MTQTRARLGVAAVCKGILVWDIDQRLSVGFEALRSRAICGLRSVSPYDRYGSTRLPDSQVLRRA